MPESLFGVSLQPLTIPQQSVTDAAAPPIWSIPIYYIHSFDRPFCANVHCPCQAHQQEVVRLLVSIIEGRVVLEPAAALLAADGKEPHA
jgi:hypothetical protein